jgi:hypothetical protein
MSREVNLIVSFTCRVNDPTWTDQDLLDNVPDYLTAALGQTNREGDPYELNDVTVWTAVDFHRDLAEGLLPPGFAPSTKRSKP